ncbi:Uncharacterized protein SCG7109_AH_00340 [Chlamydiales bacterium SCGC AG-110-M15]|nr:Uncharacterized protein SCG7109_AH_00340 [Chlamydiales bacterium SCGC AG-110-M15]
MHMLTQHNSSTYFELSSYLHSALFEDCLYPWEALNKIKAYLGSYNLGKIEIEIPEGVHLVNPELISIGTGTLIEPTAYIKGPCIIGKNCSIRHGAYIRGNVIAGDHCVIGHASEVKHSIFLNKAQAAHFAYVGDSILGNNTNLGAGTKCANLKLKGDSISVKISNKIIDTGLRKFGAIIGDDVQIGCNCVTNPGTLMGKGSLAYPCLSFGGVITPKQKVKPK